LKWCRQAGDAFEQLKLLLCSAPVLSFPQFGNDAGEFVLDVDASGESVGGVLSQCQDGVERVIAYASKCLSKSQRKYAATQRELLAIYLFVDLFRHYLLPKHFKIRTDHKPLTWIKSAKPTSLLHRWQLRISEFDFDCEDRLDTFDFSIEHRSGTSHRNADALSRFPLPNEPVCEVNVITKKFIDFQQMEKAQKDDLNFVYLKDCLTAGHVPDENKVRGISRFYQRVFASISKIRIENDILYKEDFSNNRFVLKLVISESIIKALVETVHCSVIGGHMGVIATRNKVKSDYWWPGMDRDVEEVVKTCATCQQFKPSSKPKPQQIFPIETGYPMQTIHMDIAGPLVTNEDGKKFIIVIVDSFSNWVEAEAVKSVEAEVVAKCLLDKWIYRFGAPDRLITDQGGNVAGQVIQHVCRILNIQKIRTTPYHPQGNGKAERMIGTIKRLLRSASAEMGRCWEDVLQAVLFTIRTAISRSTGYTPHFILFGRKACFPNTSRIDSFTKINTFGDYIESLCDNLRFVQEKARSVLHVNKRRTKAVFNRRIKNHSYKIDDQVWRVNKGPNSKTMPRLGPYKIIEVRGFGVYVVKDLNSNQIVVVNGRDLIRFNSHQYNQSLDLDDVSSQTDDGPQSPSVSSSDTDYAIDYYVPECWLCIVHIRVQEDSHLLERNVVLLLFIATTF